MFALGLRRTAGTAARAVGWASALYVFQAPMCAVRIEIRALLASGLVPRRLNRAALDEYWPIRPFRPEDTHRRSKTHRAGAPGAGNADGVSHERRYWDMLTIRPGDGRDL
jgi:hypothetical protein